MLSDIDGILDRLFENRRKNTNSIEEIRKWKEIDKTMKDSYWLFFFSFRAPISFFYKCDIADGHEMVTIMDRSLPPSPHNCLWYVTHSWQTEQKPFSML